MPFPRDSVAFVRIDAQGPSPHGESRSAQAISFHEEEHGHVVADAPSEYEKMPDPMKMGEFFIQEIEHQSSCVQAATEQEPPESNQRHRNQQGLDMFGLAAAAPTWRDSCCTISSISGSCRASASARW